MIPYGRQEITQEDIDSVVATLSSDFLTQGPKVPEFEGVVKSSVTAQYALAVNSATSALHLACLALGVKEGDVVWTTPISFVASANCALYCGAKVDFVDIDKHTYNMSAEKLREKLEISKKKGDLLPKVVIPVHLSGQSCEMKEIFELSQEFGFSIIEDASHAIGASYLDGRVGNCRYSDITVFSFHPVKIVTTAEGGVITTNSEDLAKKVTLLRSHGVTRDAQLMTEESHGGWYYQQIDLGFNYRMTELQAALGVSQMSRLDSFVKTRNELAERYDALLKHLPIVLPQQLDVTYSARHLYIIRLRLDEISASHREVFEQLRQLGIGVNLHYIPIHLQPYYKNMGFAANMFPEAEAYYREAISLPLFHSMTESQQKEVINCLERVLK